MWTIEMRRSKINEGKVAGQYCHLGDPSKKMVLRVGGMMRSSEVKKVISRTGFSGHGHAANNWFRYSDLPAIALGLVRQRGGRARGKRRRIVPSGSSAGLVHQNCVCAADLLALLVDVQDCVRGGSHGRSALCGRCG